MTVYDLECQSLRKTFGTFRAVNDISFAIPAGSFFSILGPSGCGKTTLLRMLAGFLEPDAGDLRIKGHSMLGVPPNRRPLNMVFQHLALFPMMNVAENIAYGLKRRGAKREEIRQRTADVLQRIGLPDAGPKRVDQLSGGQKQRVAIARCLVLEPTVLLLDEPLGALDLKLREQMKIELKQLQKTFGTTFIYITHDQSEALVMSDQVAVMNQGCFEQVGSPQELYYQPASAFVAGFVGDTNRFSGVLLEDAAGLLAQTESSLHWRITTAGKGPFSAGTEVELFVRPEAIRLARGQRDLGVDNQICAMVDTLLFDGANSRIEVSDHHTGLSLVARLPQTHEFADLKPGDLVSLGWMAGQTLCFRREEAF